MSKDPRSYLQRAEDHRRHGRLKEAIAACREALAEHPGLDAARITLGRALLETGDAAAAAETLSGVFARLPEHHLAGRTLAEAQRRLHDFAAAETTCRGLLEHYPRDREIEPLLATILEERNGAPGANAPSETSAAPSIAAPPTATTPATAPAIVKSSTPPAPPLRQAAPVDVVPKTSAVPAASVASLPVIEAAEPDPAPEYSPEDVEVASPQYPVNVGQSGTAATAGPKTVATVPRAARAEGDALATNTLAELYLRQGMTDRAVAVYRNMLRVEPGNAAVRRRLAEIEGREDVPGIVTAAPGASVSMAPPVSIAVSRSSQAAHVAMSVAAAPASASSGPVSRPVAESRPVADSLPAISPLPVARPLPVAASQPAASPSAVAPSPSLNPADKAAVERLDRWLRTIQGAAGAGGGTGA
jgi:tetratricopeptide (TPR) repeat protein